MEVFSLKGPLNKDMPVLKKLFSGDATRDEDAQEIQLVFFCPGCKSHHSYCIKSTIPGRPVWVWNKDMEKPTFAPSLLVNGRWPESRCHLFLRDGMIQFLDDCHHELKGKTVPLPECEW